MTEFEIKRAHMVKNHIQARGISDKRLLEAMRTVERQKFVPEHQKAYAYEDHPLPIGLEQTISQPYIVAEMTNTLKIKKTDRVLEIGTGSGYQAAILSQLAAEVYTVERIKPLLEKAQRVFKTCGYTNIHTLHSDGTLGWSDYSPFDAIMVTAAAPKLPQTLVDQLAVGGRMVIPVGDRSVQSLVEIYKDQQGVHVKDYSLVRFVPLIGQHGWKG
ncbi:MAG: protein-L-isoaspartate(D-aspartate) O-methyltransferase [Candidatus Magnetomorum sp.]|nr:protein-L-isoaspartate(D-aspartate) O-methyltransferase [Candidatus Magnetomorum sp.]